MEISSMLKTKHVFAFGLLTCLSTIAMADSSFNNSKKSTCPDVVTTNADTQFGAGSGDITTCISVRDDLKIVIAMNNNDINSRNGKAQQVLNINNIYNDYTVNYEMVAGKDFKAAVVAYGAGARWLLNDAAYAASYGVANPSDNMVSTLLAKGIKFYMCQNTMKGSGWVSSDLIPGVEMVPAGVTAVIDLQNRDYSYIVP